MEVFSQIALPTLKVFASCLFIVVIFRLFFKNTVTFYFVAVLCFPVALSILMGSLIGRGVIPVWAGIPIAAAAIIAGFAIIGNMVQSALKEMVDKINSLSKGDLDFTIDKKFLK
jgi:methyl-accepting chemotaxis protein